MGRRSGQEPDTPDADASGPPGLLSLIDITGLALICLRWFVPTEGTFRGDTLWISQASLGWGVLAAWSAMRNGDRWRRRPGLWNISLTLLVLGHVIATLAVCLTEGQKRAALNGMWEWISIAITAVWFHHRAASLAFRRTYRITLIASAIALAGLGVWQRWVLQPQLGRAVLEYDDLSAKLPTLEGQPRREAESRLRKLRETVGPEYTSLDDAGRRAMRQRLIDSTEPIGRFALANSFSALLMVGLFLAVGELVPLLWSLRSSTDIAPRGPPAHRGLAIVAALFIAFVLLLTKSRTAWAGSIAGTAMAAVFMAQGRKREVLYFAALSLGLATILVAFTWAAGGLDALVLSETPKSLEYRMEYWLGTWDVIKDHPWLGVGPGNFRQHYLAHKAAKSSEEILDPHDFLLEAWVTGGLTAFLGLLGIGLTCFYFSRRMLVDVSGEEKPTGRSSAPAILLAATGLLAFKEWALDGYGDGELFIVSAVAIVSAWSLNRATSLRTAASQPTAETASLAAWFALSVHLLGAGGMEMPAIIQLWLCLSSLVVAARQEHSPTTSRLWPRRTAGAMTAVCAASFVGQLVTATAPSLGARAMVDLADAESMTGARPDRIDQLLQQAAESDRLDPTPWQRRAQFAFAEWLRSRSEPWFDKAISAQQEAIHRDPRHSHLHRALAELFLKRFSVDQRPADAAAAVEAIEHAMERYPNSVTGRRILTESLSAAGRTADAKVAALRTLELDALYQKLGHFDKTLTAEERAAMQSLAGDR